MRTAGDSQFDINHEGADGGPRTPHLARAPRRIPCTASSGFSPLHSSSPASRYRLTETFPSGGFYEETSARRRLASLDLLQGISTGQTTVTWNSGETTTYTWESTAAQVGDNISTTTVGTVTAGKFLGKHVLRQTTAVQTAIESACESADGLQHETGTVIFTITGL